MADRMDQIPERFEITAARTEDVPEIADIMREGWLQSFVDERNGVTKEFIQSRFEGEIMDKRIAEFAKQINEGPEKYLVARSPESKVVAYASFYTNDANFIDALFVRQAYQGTLGLKLMLAVEQQLAPEKDTRLAVVATNDRAKGLYERVGFQEEERFPRTLKTPAGERTVEMIQMIRKAKTEKA